MSWKDLFSEKDFSSDEFDEIIAKPRYGDPVERYIWVDDGEGSKRSNPNKPKKKRRMRIPIEDAT